MDAHLLESRRIRVDRRRLLISAPQGDAYLARFGRGQGLAEFGTLCRHALTPEAVLIDVGANIGLTTLVAAPILARGRIISIEASPRNCAALRVNLERAGVTNAAIVESAVGARAGTVAFHDASAYGHVVTGGNMADLPGASQRIAPLDEIGAEHGLDRVDLIKIDVEGFERDVIEGAQAILARHDPLVLLEFNSWCMIGWFDRSPRQFLDWLLDRFPQLYRWRGGRLTDLRKLGRFDFLREHLTVHNANDDLLAAGPRTDVAKLARELEATPFGRLGAGAGSWFSRR